MAKFPLWTMKVLAKYPQNQYSLFDTKIPLILLCKKEFGGLSEVAILIPKDLRS